MNFFLKTSWSFFLLKISLIQNTNIMQLFKILFFLLLLPAVCLCQDTIRADYFIQTDGADQLTTTPATVVFDSSFVSVSFQGEEIRRSVAKVVQSKEGAKVFFFLCGGGLRLTESLSGSVDGAFLSVGSRSFYFGINKYKKELLK